MNKTQKLYFDDAYLVEFEAAVVARLVHQGQPAAVLDRTCFYPESGGQPWDKGTLDGVEVLNVVEDGEMIVHVLAKDLPSDRVKGKIDWAARFDHMQQHSGQHILSQAFFESLKGETRSFHLGADVSTLEIALAMAADGDIERVERRANAIVFENREIKTYFVPEERIGEIPLRRPPKVTGLIRVVEADAFDYSACGGTHCRRTGEIGLIKIVKSERIRGNLRFEFVCGGRALRDYALKNRIVRQLIGQFNVKEIDIAVSVARLAEELKTAKKRLRGSEEALSVFEARGLMDKAEGKIIREIFGDKSPEGARFLALNIIRQGEYVVLFGARSETRSHLILACSETLTLDMRRLTPIVAPLMNGRGGGGPTLVEIAGDLAADLRGVIAAAEDFVRKNLA
jgi:alanyl-tRNA synthetase